MKTIQQIKEQYKSETIDRRDLGRLAQFLSTEDMEPFGFAPKDPDNWVPTEFTRDNVLNQLKEDVAFGFEKALNKRGISASLMYEVVRMWNWILEEGLEDFDDYAQYGLPLFKATAVKYGFPNLIGDDEGDEFKYSIDGDYDDD